MSKQKELALKVRANMEEMGISHNLLTGTLGCGATLVTMFTGNYEKPASKMTLYVLEKLSDRKIMARLGGWLMKKAKSEYPTSASVIRKVGINNLERMLGVTASSIRRWRKESSMQDLWGKPDKPRISLAALRLLALELVSEGSEEPELDLFALAEKEKPEVKVAIPAPKEMKSGNAQKNIAKNLRDLADLSETVFLDIKTRSEMADLLNKMTGVVRGAAMARKKEIEKELAKMHALGV